jgi:hypothetical protein
MHISVSRPVRIARPTGTVDAYRLALTPDKPQFACTDGGVFPSYVYVSVTAPHRVLRIERPAQGRTLDVTKER